MSFNETLTQKEKELVAVGASIAAGCQPCSAHHFKTARAAGAAKAEIRQAVDDALCVRDGATKIMASFAKKHLDGESNTEVLSCSEKPLIGELVAASAALAVNCVASLETHLAIARRLGATERQIQTALGVARAIKKVAGQKMEAVATTVAEPAKPAESKAGDGRGDDCSCHETNGSQARDAIGDCGVDESIAATVGVEVENK